MLASTKDLINLEAHDGIKHVKAAHQLDSKIEELKFEDSQLDDIITLMKALIENINTNFV